jgi:hypothetical protein
MREAAKVLSEVNERTPFGRWGVEHLEALADRFEAEDSAKADLDAMVEELARDIALAEFPDASWPDDFESGERRAHARKVITFGWTNQAPEPRSCGKGPCCLVDGHDGRCER